jgi:hypothetical protein
MAMFMMSLAGSFGKTELEDEAGTGSLAFCFMMFFNAVFVAGWLIAAAANLGS